MHSAELNWTCDAGTLDSIGAEVVTCWQRGKSWGSGIGKSLKGLGSDEDAVVENGATRLFGGAVVDGIGDVAERKMALVGIRKERQRWWVRWRGWAFAGTGVE